MNKMMMSVLFASGNESKLNELTLHRTTASLPFGGRYRLIDFALSNMVNSGITTIGLVTRSNYSSLMDHIRMGRDWDLNRKNSGIAVFPPFVLGSSREIYKGKIEALHTILNFDKGKGRLCGYLKLQHSRKCQFLRNIRNPFGNRGGYNGALQGGKDDHLKAFGIE